MTQHTPPQPGFLIIGAQKCGTSWLHSQLSRQPGLYLPPQKELEFFSYEPHLADPGITGYRENFVAAGNRMCGEATPSYFWSWSDNPWCNMPAGFQRDIPGVVRASLGPELRLILCLRDPVKRAISAWGHYLAHGEIDPALPFREACRYGGIVDMGFYARHLSRWLEVYPAKRILILHLEEDIITDPEQALRRATGFLGVDYISSGNELLNSPVFPGPDKTGTEAGITIQLDTAGQAVHVSRDELEWLATLYGPDQDSLAQIAPGTFAYAA